MPEEYLQAVKRCVTQALIQTGKLSRCEHHDDVLLHTGDETDLHVAANLATIWIKDEAGIPSVMRADLNEAIREALVGAARGGCPKCHAEQNA